MTPLVGFATQDWARWLGEDGRPTLGGSGHYRCALPAEAIRSLGHGAVVGTLVVHNQTGAFGVKTWDDEYAYPHVLVMQRYMHGDLPTQVLRARSHGQVILNDVDDWWEGLDPSNRAFASTHPRADPLINRDHYRRILGASTAIVCSTPFLVERYARLAPTVLVRNHLDLDRWRAQEPRDGPPVLGWVGALPWRTTGDVEALGGFLASFLQRHGLRLRHAGALAPGWDLALAARIPPHLLDQSPMVPIGGHERQFEGMDIALVPLADKPFNHAKSALKGMQAAAAGVPFVASSTPEYEWLRTDMGIGHTARRSRDWIARLEALMDPGRRAVVAMEGEARVAAMGLPSLARKWHALLSTLPVGVAA